MKSFDLNQFPNLIQSEKMSREEGLQKIAEFISCNHPVFGLQVYDEDFREEVILIFLEKGISIFDTFNPELGDFFTYLYSYIKNISTSLKKKMAKQMLQEDITETEIKRTYQQPEYSYCKQESQKLVLKDAHVPYKSSRLSPQELKDGLYFAEDSKLERILLSLAIKSSFYLTDSHIEKLSLITGLDKDFLSKLFEYFNCELERKIEKRKSLENNRNRAYYCHRKYEKQIQLLQDDIQYNSSSSTPYAKEVKLQHLEYVNEKQKKNWKRLNDKFQNGFANVKPSNLSIASILGICERQVSYYLFCAKSGKTDLSEITKRIEEMDKD